MLPFACIGYAAQPVGSGLYCCYSEQAVRRREKAEPRAKRQGHEGREERADDMM